MNTYNCKPDWEKRATKIGHISELCSGLKWRELRMPFVMKIYKNQRLILKFPANIQKLHLKL